MKNKNLIIKSEEVSIYDFVNRLIDENEGSAFFPNWFHYKAIIGINSETKSIIYSLEKLVDYEIALRYEEGGLNPEYDDVDDDILIVAQDSMLRLFIMMQQDKDNVPPTLYDENTQSEIDPYVLSKFDNEIEYVVGNEVSRKTKELDMPSKEFTQDQLEGFISENEEAEYFRWIELQMFNPSSTLELVPRELIDFDDEEPVIRCVVKLVDEPYWLGFQDLTFDQWELGKAINQEAA